MTFDACGSTQVVSEGRIGGMVLLLSPEKPTDEEVMLSEIERWARARRSAIAASVPFVRPLDGSHRRALAPLEVADLHAEIVRVYLATLTPIVGEHAIRDAIVRTLRRGGAILTLTTWPKDPARRAREEVLRRAHALAMFRDVARRLGLKEQRAKDDAIAKTMLATVDRGGRGKHRDIQSPELISKLWKTLGVPSTWDAYSRAARRAKGRTPSA